MGSAFFILGKVKLDGEITRLLLRRRKIRQQELAEILGVWPSQIAHYLEGKTPIPGPRLEKLLKVLGLKDPSVILLPRQADHVR